MGFGVFIGQIKSILVRAHRHIAGDLQGRNRFTDALRTTK
jgi:hypothetical protein